VAAEHTAKVWGKTRIEALSDGVFAIAVTLLVLDIRIPELPRGAPSREVWHAMAAIGPVFLSFLITFVLAGSFWFMHHATLHSVKYVTRGIASINLLFLMFISLLPFSTGLIGRLGPNHPAALAVYFTNQLALGLTLNLLWAYAKRHRLVEQPLPDPGLRFMIAAQPFAATAALGFVPFQPVGSYYAFLIAMLIARLIARRRYKSPAPDAPALL
jgi:uncharacterized membrane protein